MKGIASFRFSMRIIAVSCQAFIIAIACLISLSDAHAEVHVSGSRDAVTVQAKNASLGDIIAAVDLALNVKISIAPAINIAVMGTYSGSLRRVLARMLAGYDFVLGSSGDRITIIIILATQAGTGSGPRPLAINGADPAPANVPVPDGDVNTTGIQGWSGGYSPKSPSAGRPK